MKFIMLELSSKLHVGGTYCIEDMKIDNDDGSGIYFFDDDDDDDDVVTLLV